MPTTQDCCCSACLANPSLCNRRSEAGTLRRWISPGHDWCGCVPRRACASLLADCDDAESVLASAYMILLCNELSTPSWDTPRPRPAYSGTLSVGGVAIDVLFMIDDDEYGELWMYLTSAVLGYVEENGYDNRLRLPMAGEYGDNDTKKTNCKELGLAFEVDLAYVLDGYGTGCIRIDAADMIALDRRHVCGPHSASNSCLCERACITYEELDEYGEQVYIAQKKVCIQGGDYESIWLASFRDDAVDVSIAVVAEQGQPLRFRLDPFTVPGGTFTADVELADVCCPAGSEDVEYAETETACLMKATWTGLIEYDYGYGYDYDSARSIVVTIRGEPRYRCSDCMCFCRCLCVTRYDHDTGAIHQGVICWDEYDTDSWVGDVPLLEWDSEEVEWRENWNEAQNIRLSVHCGQCTGVTSIQYQGLLSSQANNCPDVSADFTIDDGDEHYSIYARCAVCPSTCPSPGRIVDCCGDDPIPAALYATFTPVPPCPGEEFEVSLAWQEIIDPSTAPIYYIGSVGAVTGYYAYVSGWFQMPGAGAKLHRIFVAPCAALKPPCEDPTPVAWDSWMVSEDWPDAGHDCDGTLGATCMADCSAILLTGSRLCGCIAADYGGWDVVISE